MHSAVQSNQYLTKIDRTLENQVNQDLLQKPEGLPYMTYTLQKPVIYTTIMCLGSLKEMGTHFWLSWVEILL